LFPNPASSQFRVLTKMPPFDIQFHLCKCSPAFPVFHQLCSSSSTMCPSARTCRVCHPAMRLCHCVLLLALMYLACTVICEFRLHLVLLCCASPTAQRSISAVHNHQIATKLCQPAKRISAELAPWLLALSNPQHPPIVYVSQLICHHVIFRHSSYRHSVSYSSIFLTGYVRHQLQCTQQLQDY
jgi:hypothetical protein